MIDTVTLHRFADDPDKFRVIVGGHSFEMESAWLAGKLDDLEQQAHCDPLDDDIMKGFQEVMGEFFESK